MEGRSATPAITSANESKAAAFSAYRNPAPCNIASTEGGSRASRPAGSDSDPGMRASSCSGLNATRRNQTLNTRIRTRRSAPSDAS